MTWYLETVGSSCSWGLSIQLLQAPSPGLLGFHHHFWTTGAALRHPWGIFYPTCHPAFSMRQEEREAFLCIPRNPDFLKKGVRLLLPFPSVLWWANMSCEPLSMSSLQQDKPLRWTLGCGGGGLCSTTVAWLVRVSPFTPVAVSLQEVIQLCCFVWKVLSLRINITIWHLQWRSNQTKILHNIRNSAVSSEFFF